MTRGVFVTGTDTGVGKTRVAVALLAGLAAEGVVALGMKPVAAGVAPGAARNADVTALVAAAAASASAAVGDVNPYAFAPPIAPHLAAADARRGRWAATAGGRQWRSSTRRAATAGFRRRSR